MKTYTVESEFIFLYPLSQTYLNYDIFYPEHLLTSRRMHLRCFIDGFLPGKGGRLSGVVWGLPILSPLTVALWL